MSLAWTPDNAGFTATVGKQTVRVGPLSESEMGRALRHSEDRWFAYSADKMLILPDTGLSWPSSSEAQAACERSIVPKKRGRKPGRTVRFARYLPTPLVEAARAEALRRDPTGQVITDGHVIAEWAERGRVMP